MNKKDAIKEALNEMEQISAPDFLEEDVMSMVNKVERTKVRYISLTNIAIFTGLSAVLLLVSLALYYYVPDILWLYEVKVSVGIVLVLYIVYALASWLPVATQYFMKNSK